MNWVFLGLAGIFEVVWAIGLKYSEGFSKLLPSIITGAGMVVSFYFLSLALKELPLGTAYAIWTGIGTIGTVIISGIIFKETLSVPQILCIMVIVCGIVGLKLLTPNA